jgi:hypothetical protein
VAIVPPQWLPKHQSRTWFQIGFQVHRAQTGPISVSFGPNILARAHSMVSIGAKKCHSNGQMPTAYRFRTDFGPVSLGASKFHPNLHSMALRQRNPKNRRFAALYLEPAQKLQICCSPVVFSGFQWSLGTIFSRIRRFGYHS